MIFALRTFCQRYNTIRCTYVAKEESIIRPLSPMNRYTSPFSTLCKSSIIEIKARPSRAYIPVGLKIFRGALKARFRF